MTFSFELVGKQKSPILLQITLDPRYTKNVIRNPDFKAIYTVDHYKSAEKSIP